MPELVEVKMTSEFVARHGSKNFVRMEKSPVSKVKTDLSGLPSSFNLLSESRGKEMVIDVKNDSFSKRMKVTLGMSGTWLYYDPSDEATQKYHRHTHLRVFDENGWILGLYDTRRFAKWSWRDFDLLGRSPCPFSDFDNFQQNVVDNYESHRDFERPLSEVVMNQRWFNGVGNYLRAEILYRLDKNPFAVARSLDMESVKRLTLLVNDCVSTVYKLGGGQLKDWKSPTGENPASFREWVKCYGKLGSVLDSTGRTFWFDNKWKNETD